MMIPNTTGMLSRRLAQNVYSEFTYAAPVQVRCAVVDFKEVIARTSVRVDQSATRGNTEELTMVAKILFPPSVGIQEDDEFEIMGKKMRVLAIQQRNNVLGQHDHDDVDLGILI
jgi:hypothetical protein